MNHSNFYSPSDSEVTKVQQALGFDRMQAYYHCQGRQRAAERAEAKRREAYSAALRNMSEATRG